MSGARGDGTRRLGILVCAALALGGFDVARATAQTGETETRTEVMAVIDGLFDAMRGADSAAARRAFHPELLRLASSGEREGTPAVGFGEVERFVRSIGGAAPGDLDERIGEAEIRVDDNLATVFTPYAFHYKGQLSHCGVNVFLVARTADGWKIVGLADTRRGQGCEEWLP